MNMDSARLIVAIELISLFVIIIILSFIVLLRKRSDPDDEVYYNSLSKISQRKTQERIEKKRKKRECA